MAQTPMRIVPHLLIGLLGIASASAFDSVVIINEIHYNPAAGQQEFVELRNLNGVDINLGRWRLSGGADYTFPEGTIIPGHGYLVLGNVAGALAPFTGALSNSGETLRLRNQNDRIMDEVTYSDSGDWPTGADGSGFTLARRTSDANPDPTSWTFSQQPGGTPGSLNFLTGTPVDRTLIANDTAWKFYDADTAPPASWAAANFVDTSWATGTANFGTGGSSTPSLTVTANLVERFRASAITGVADGGVVATWADTATGDGATQSGVAGTTTPTLRLNTTPTGKASVRFDGNDQIRTTILPGIAPTSGFCYWIVLKANAAQTSGFTTDGSGNYIFDRTLTAGGAPLVSLKAVGGAFGLQKRYDNNTGLGGPVTTSPISQTAYQIVTVRRNTAASRWEMWVNGVMESTEADSGAALTPDPIHIGRYSSGTTQGFIGDIAEILIYKDSLSAGDFQAVGTYLESEYGLDTAFPGSAITTPLSATAPTTYFRRTFNYPGVVSLTSLRLENIGADGSVFYLNGTEIQRTNLPAGAVSHTTPANADVPAPASTGYLTVPASALVNGTNVLAVSLHRAAGSADSLFDASLAATESPEDPALAQKLVFNEIPGAPDFPFFVEI
ncbi:MAG: exported protein of unknown function, partial [Verrucomicrobiales bacterium]|nr:exported protein of unknown function [Verrucomicrobiales bacterium]